MGVRQVDRAPVQDEVREATADNDADVVALIRDGDHHEALRRLMTRHGTGVYRYCREQLHDATLADDVNQQIFIQAFRDMGRFAQRSTLRTWLFAIARHRVLDAVKARRRASAHLEDDDSADTPDPTPPPGDQLDDARLQLALVDCMTGLGDHIRDAVLLHYQQGFSYEEMAELCSEKAGTLQARVARALPALRACIQQRTRSKL